MSTASRQQIADQSGQWLAQVALPLWRDRGFNARTGQFEEALDAQAGPVQAPRRSRVQARQIFVFAEAERRGLCEGAGACAWAAWRQYLSHFAAEADLFVFSITEDGGAADSGVRLYEQAFALFAMAALVRLDPDAQTVRRQARRTLQKLDGFRHGAGGFRELGSDPFQSNAQMHLFEAAMAWSSLDPDGPWTGLADEIADLAMSRLIDAEHGFIREHFTADWRPAPAPEGEEISPGHQFEWSWLLGQYAKPRGLDLSPITDQLWRAGLRGVDPSRAVAVNALSSDLSHRDSQARLWPQTEWLKAALTIGDEVEIARAGAALSRYLKGVQPGLWRDTLNPDGTWVEEPSPASSLYHIAGAIFEACT